MPRTPLLTSRILPAVLLCLLACACPARAQAGPSLEIMAGRMVMVGFRGLEPDARVLRDITEVGVGGVVLFDYDSALKSPVRNIESPEQVRALTSALAKAAPHPLLLAVDQEGGRVARLKARAGFPAPGPSAAALGRMGNLNATRMAGEETGKVLASCGLNLDLAPVVDVNVNPLSPAIGALDRSFSTDPRLVAAQAAAFVQGLHAAGVLSCLKHFPGHGSAEADTHQGLVDVSRTWTRAELTPYRLLIRRGLADMVMTAHVFNSRLDPANPATLSRDTLAGLLRGGLGFTGVIATDDMQMGAVAENYGFEQAVGLAVLAGADMVLVANNLRYDPDAATKARDAIVSLVRHGRLPMERVRASYARIRALCAKLAALRG